MQANIHKKNLNYLNKHFKYKTCKNKIIMFINIKYVLRIGMAENWQAF